MLLPAVFLLWGAVLHVHATEDERRAIPVETNALSGWPEGPVTGAKAAIVIEVNENVILYAKNIHERLYPASTTKLMTCLLAAEHASLSDTVQITYSAVSAVPPDGSHIGMDPGQSITMEEALYGIMVGSANEVSNAVAEHVSGSVGAFAALMNERAASLGLQNTHFTNANGLHDPDHYTTAYDLAIIAKAFFENVSLSGIGNTPRYHFEPSANQPDDFWLRNKHALITGDVAVEGVLGGKTGFTDEAGECLVTCAERNGMRLVSVVLFEASPAQFTDSAALLEYGFNNFAAIQATGHESGVLPETPAFFLPDRSLFGRDVSTLSFQMGDKLILPADADFSDAHLTSVEAASGGAESRTVAVLSYDWDGQYTGRVRIRRQVITPEHHALTDGKHGNTRVRYIDIRYVLAAALLVTLVIHIVFSGIYLGYGIYLSPKARNRRRLRRQRKQGLNRRAR